MGEEHISLEENQRLFLERTRREASPSGCESMSFVLANSASPLHLVNDNGEEKRCAMMDERQVMERRQEINRIEQMGKVSVISLQ